MSEELIIKYKFANDRAIEPRKATIGSVGHNIFAAEDKILQPGLCTTVLLEINMEIYLKGTLVKFTLVLVYL